MNPNVILRGSKQQGLTLFTVLILLLLITLVSITSFKLSTANLQVVDNMQLRNQTIAAARAAIEKTISTPVFATTPNVAVTTFVSVGGSSTNDIRVVTTPTCIEIQPIPNSALNLTNPADVGCAVGIGQTNGVVGTSNINSLCASSLWDIQAVATDLSTNSTSIVHKGVSLRVPITATCP
jgi:Tfp pilus assembly protein PilX